MPTAAIAFAMIAFATMRLFRRHATQPDMSPREMLRFLLQGIGFTFSGCASIECLCWLCIEHPLYEAFWYLWRIPQTAVITCFGLTMIDQWKAHSYWIEGRRYAEELQKIRREERKE